MRRRCSTMLPLQPEPRRPLRLETPFDKVDEENDEPAFDGLRARFSHRRSADRARRWEAAGRRRVQLFREVVLVEDLVDREGAGGGEIVDEEAGLVFEATPR